MLMNAAGYDPNRSLSLSLIKWFLAPCWVCFFGCCGGWNAWSFAPTHRRGERTAEADTVWARTETPHGPISLNRAVVFLDVYEGRPLLSKPPMTGASTMYTVTRC
jgi:hypothetical protein